MLRASIDIFLLMYLMLGAEGKRLPVNALKFPNAEWAFILKNNVDTMYMVSPDTVLNFGYSDTFGTAIYNAGLPAHITIVTLGGYGESFEYNKRGWVKNKIYDTDFRAAFKVKYSYAPGNMTLQQYWSGNSEDTCYFQFNTAGQLVSSLEYSNDDHGKGRLYKRTFSYNANSFLMERNSEFQYIKEGVIMAEKDNGEPSCTGTNERWYYTGTMPDSAITTYIHVSDSAYNYTNRTYYNRQTGLRDYSVMQDSLVTHYLYHHRK